MEKVLISERPNFPKRFFWEFKYEKIDWRKEYPMIIERILTRGHEEEWKELVRFYGIEKVVHTLRHEVLDMPYEILETVCRYFQINPLETKCYIRKQSRQRHWI